MKRLLVVCLALTLGCWCDPVSPPCHWVYFHFVTTQHGDTIRVTAQDSLFLCEHREPK